MTYSELIAYFESIDLPTTLLGKYRYYRNVPKTIERHKERIRVEGMLHKDLRKSEDAMQSKQDLLELYNDLQIKENWNVILRENE